ncbi:hypothetical protein [Bradyrhizobium nitroreducens]|uniref:hypothetical protein n=1 Tax=Bradyrhizobium nitroreducens TaxID=709803 RepID=UPI0011AEA043|nr:hypothetical protein [Bradyrhizobium nitroreducens]
MTYHQLDIGFYGCVHLARPMALAHHARFEGDWVTGASSKVKAGGLELPCPQSSLEETGQPGVLKS